MPKFQYTAIAGDGSSVRGVENAVNLSAASVAIAERDLQPVQVMERKSVWQFEIARKKVNRKELMHFSRQLAVFIRAGIPILAALQVISEETGDKLFRTALLSIVDDLNAGETFAGAAARHPEAFPPFYLGILHSAELSGTLDIVLEQLASYVERDLEAKRKITSALVYPAMVFAMSVVTVVILTAFVLPRFETFFKSFNAKLPLPTRMLLDLSGVLQAWWFVFVAGVFLLLIGGGLLQRTSRGRMLHDKAFLNLPGLGDVVRHAVLERFCRVLSSMVGAGVPLPDALQVTIQATNNAVFSEKLAIARQSMLRGDGFAAPLAQTDLFPSAAKQMFRVGEDTGTLDAQLQSAAVFFDRELEYKIKRFTTLFEPAVIVFMGVVVGFVAIALVSAMYGIYHQVNIPQMRTAFGDEHGFTLVEVIVALAILGLAVTFIVGAMTDSVIGSDVNRKQANADTIIRTYADAIQNFVAGGGYQSCPVTAPNTTYGLTAVGYTPPSGYTVTISAISYWQGSLAANGQTLTNNAFSTTCPSPDRGLQQLSLQVSSCAGSPCVSDRRDTDSLTILIRTP